MLVYKAINTITNKIYVGYTTKSLDERKKVHLYKSRCKSNVHYNYIFLSAIRKYGFDNFEWEVVEYCKTIEECCKKEIFYIKQFNSITPNGYNLTEGGNGGIASEKVKKKISKSLKEYFKNNPCLSHKSKTPEERSNASKKAWITKRHVGYKTTKGFTHSSISKKEMSKTKNLKGRCNWLNVQTGEKQFLSLTEMSKHTGLTIGTFSHLKQGRSIQTYCGWTLNQ